MAPQEPKVSRDPNRTQSPHRSSRGGRAIDHVVMHYTTSRNIEGTIRHFQTPSAKVSAHYVIGQDGELVQMVPESMAAWHAGTSGMNARSIGIEHVAAPGDRITPEQERTSAALIRWLIYKYGIPQTQVIPHVAVKSTDCPGDLFADYGGAAGASKAQQGAALARWLAARVFGKPETETEPRKEIAMDDTPAPAPAPTKSPAQSVTIWGSIITALSLVAPTIGTAVGVPITPEIVTGVAGIIMTIVGRFGARSALSVR